MTKRLSSALYYLIISTLAIFVVILINLIHLVAIVKTVLEIVLPVFFGYILSWALHPIHNRLKKKLPEKLSIVILATIMILLYVGIVLIAIPIFISEFGNFQDIIMSYIPRLKNIPFLDIDANSLTIKPEMILESCGGLISIVLNFALAHIFGFYLLYNYESIGVFFRRIIPSRYRTLAKRFTKSLSANMYCYLKGTLIDTVALFGIAVILFYSFHLKYAVLLALIIAITNVIPFVGPYIGGVPAVLVGLSVGIKTGVVALCIVIFCQMVESNLVNPLIMSKCVKINPLFIIVAITIMGKFFGILGMVFAVPILIFLKISIEFWPEFKKLRTS